MGGMKGIKKAGVWKDSGASLLEFRRRPFQPMPIKVGQPEPAPYTVRLPDTAMDKAEELAEEIAAELAEVFEPAEGEDAVWKDTRDPGPEPPYQPMPLGVWKDTHDPGPEPPYQPMPFPTRRGSGHGTKP
jgi:hypothetical protein